MRPFLPDLHDAVLWPGHGPLDQQEMVLGIDVVHNEADLRHSNTTEAAGHLDSLADTRGGRRGAYRAGLPDVVRAVGLRAPVEPVPLDRAGKPFSDRRAGNFDRIPRLER